MKFVYVIVGTEENFMIEQGLLSIYTLRKHNPDAIITVLMDDETSQLIKKYNSPILDYVDEVQIPPLPEGLLPIQKSRYLKTSLRRLVRGKLLYIDSDTIITDSLKELETLDYDVAAVANRHGYYDREGIHPMNKHYYKATGIDPGKDLRIKRFFNGGVVFCKDTEIAFEFFDTWHKLWWETSSEKGFHKDQIGMWHADTLMGDVLKDLNGIYNCQMVYPKECLPYLWDAKILHYFSTTPFISHLKIKNKDFLLDIRKTGITKNNKKDLDNIKSEYYNGLEIQMDTAIIILHSSIAELSKKIFYSSPRFFKFLNRASAFILRLWGKNYPKSDTDK